MAMLKHAAVFAIAVILALAVLGFDATNKSAPVAGSWQVDTRHSDAKLTTDATTDFGKTKINVTLGFARVNGTMKIDSDPAMSNVEFRIYPATSMSPIIAEDGKLLSRWLENMSNHTLVCFHSKRVVRTADGRLQATGDLVVTRVDRNVESAPGEAYAGPVYGPPMIHRVTHEATFVFDLGGATGSAGIQASGSTKVFREDFPQLVRTVVSTFWPVLVMDEDCQTPQASEAYSGTRCTGTFMETSGLPQAPHAANAEDLPGPSDFNAIVGENLVILVNMHLVPKV